MSIRVLEDGQQRVLENGGHRLTETDRGPGVGFDRFADATWGEAVAWLDYQNEPRYQ